MDRGERHRITRRLAMNAGAPVRASAPPDAGELAPLAPVALLPVVVIGVVLVALAVLFLNAGQLNVDGFVAVQGLARRLPDTVWSMVTICGTGVVAFALLSPTLAWQPRWFAAGVAAAGIAGLYSNLLKHLFALPRPASILDAARLHVIGETLHANTFPSGHSVTAFTLAALLVLAARRPLRVAAWAVPCATLVAFSRLAVGAHWPADITAGAAGGWLSGALGVMIVARWRIWNTANGIRLLALVSIGIGVSLFIVDLGYPLGLPLQYVSGVVAIVAGAVTLRRPRLDPLLPRHDRPAEAPPTIER